MNLIPSDILRVTTSGSATVDVRADWTQDGGPNRTLQAFTTAATKAIATCAGSPMTVTGITIRNTDSASVTVTVTATDGSTTTEIHEATLLGGGELHYTEHEGWTTVTPGEVGVVNTVILAADVENALETPAYADVTGLSFPVVADQSYWFRFVIPYTSAATTTGSAWSIDGPADPTTLHYTSTYTLTATSNTVNSATAYDIPAAANATSLTAGNLAVIEGFITPSASGTVIARCFSEVTLSAITALAGALVEWKRVL